MGIDEAGRGCVLGPMAMGCVVMDTKGWDSLWEIGVKDSKALSPKKRLQLEKEINKIALYSQVTLIPPETIDRYCAKNLLNVLEAEAAARLIEAYSIEKVYIDAPGKGGKKFKLQLLDALNPSISCEIIAENKADVLYPAVSAASILAKVSRDRAISDLKKVWGDFGSGYPGDGKTSRFLKKYYEENHDFPDFVRVSWATIQRITTGFQSEWF